MMNWVCCELVLVFSYKNWPTSCLYRTACKHFATTSDLDYLFELRISYFFPLYSDCEHLKYVELSITAPATAGFLV